MKPVSLLFSGRDARLRSVVDAARQRAFPGGTVTPVPSLSAALARGEPEGLELLALENPAADEKLEAIAATDRAGLPRWAVVVFADGAEDGPVEVIPPGEWDAARVARAFQSAAALHALRRENTRLRGEFATIGSRLNHDLRTPLGCILTMSELMKDLLPETDPARSRLLLPIVASVNEAVRLIERMSLLAKTTASDDGVESLNMGLAFGNALLRREGPIAGCGASVEQPATWPTVKGNASLLEAVWLSLLDNALQHGGKAIVVGWSQGDGERQFWIRDGGPDIPPERRGSLFQPFHRLYEENAVQGLGLPIMRRLVEMHDGRCGYEPSDDGGRFYFTLPEGGRGGS